MMGWVWWRRGNVPVGVGVVLLILGLRWSCCRCRGREQRCPLRRDG